MRKNESNVLLSILRYYKRYQFDFIFRISRTSIKKKMRNVNLYICGLCLPSGQLVTTTTKTNTINLIVTSLSVLSMRKSMMMMMMMINLYE